MVAGYWVNQDGLLINYGTTKAVPEVGGDFLAYAETRLAEFYISFPSTTWGQTTGVPVQIPGVANTFTSGTTPTGVSSAGLISNTLMFPMQVTVPSVSNTTQLVTTTNLWIDRVETEMLITAVTGSTGTATGLQGVGFVIWNANSSLYQQVTPNAATQLVGAWTSAAMTAGSKQTWWPIQLNAAATAFPSTASIVGGNWLGPVPQISNTSATVPTLTSPMNPSGFPQWAYIGTWATGGGAAASTPYGGTSAAGLARVRVFYNIYGNIQA